MRIRRNLILTSLALTLAATACGTSTNAPETGTNVEPVAPVGGDDAVDAPPAAGAPVALALQANADADAYRATMAMGMEMSLGDGQLEMAVEADPSRPTMFVDVDAEGEQYMRFDMGSMMTSMLESSGMSADDMEQFFGDMTMETWIAGDVMTMDVGGFGDMMTNAPGAAAIFPAEVFTLDLARLGDAFGGPAAASAMTGQAAPDPVEMASVLGELLGDAEVSDATFSGTIGFLDYSRAFGQDPEAMLGNMGAMFDDMDGLGDAMLDVFEAIDVDVTGTIVDDAIDTMRFDMDLSPIWDQLPAIMEAAGQELPAEELAEMDAMLDGAVFTMAMLIDYDIDPTVEVEVPAGDFPDATDQWLELFGQFTA